jgi:hypothetical protein
MKYVVCAPVWEGETWGYSYPALTTFETSDDEKAIAIFRRHKYLATQGRGRGSFLVSGKVSWRKTAILCRSGDCNIKTALAGPKDPAIYDDKARTDEEEAEHQEYIRKLMIRYR